jgi:hypothetical protein
VSASRGVTRVALVAALLLLGLPFVPARAQAQEQAPEAATVPPLPPTGIHLEHQDPWVTVGGHFTMLLGVDDPSLVNRPNAAIQVRVGPSATARSSFDGVITDNKLGGVLSSAPLMPTSRLPRLGRNLAVTLALAGSDVATTIAVRSRGVYPVEVSLTNTGRETRPFITWLVVVDDAEQPIDEPLMVSSIWPVTAPPARLPDGGIDPAAKDQMTEGGRLDRVSTLLRRTTDTPISLSIGPETIDAWSRVAETDEDAAAGLARVRDAARRATTQLLPTPYVPVDLPALESNGFSDLVPELFAKGNATTHRILGTAPSDEARTMFLEPTGDVAADRLRDMAITRLAVRETSLEPVTYTSSPSKAFSLTTAGGRSLAVATAPYVESLLAGDDAPALRAQRVIAALAEVAYEFPSIPRGVVLAPTADWQPDLAAYTALYEALREFPLATPVTLDDLFDRISREENEGVDLERQFSPAVSGTTAVTRDAWDSARQELESYRAVAPADEPVVAQGEDALYRVLSSAVTPEQAEADLANISTAVDTFTGGVSVDAKRVTLTSRRAQIPITFENRLNRPVTVQVHLESEKLLFPEGADVQVTLPPGRTTLRERFIVEARTSGTFPLEIRLTTADGGLSFGETTQVTVRSTVFGGFAIALTIGALVFLAIWWANHFRRTRRARRQAAPALT